MHDDARIIRRATGWLAGALIAIGCATAWAASGTWSTNGPHGGRIFDLINYEAGSGTLWTAAGGGLFRTTSGGASWQRLVNGLPGSYLYGLAASTASPVLYASSGAQLFRSGNGGDLWVPIGTPAGTGAMYDIAVQRPSADNIAILAVNGAWTSNNGGGTWTGGTLPAANYRVLEYAADGTLYVGLYRDASVFGGAALIKSTTAAASWTPVTMPASVLAATLVASSPVDPQRLFVVGNGVPLVTSPDAGATWSEIPVPTGCGAVSAITPHPTLAAGLFVGCTTLGVAVTSDVDTPAWTVWDAGDGLTVNGTDPVQAQSLQVDPAWPAVSHVYVATQDGGILRTTDGGATWVEINNGIEATNIRALATHPLDTGTGAVVLAGYGDTASTSHPVYRSPDGGATWSPSHAGLNAEQVRGLTIDPTTVDDDAFTNESFTVYAAGLSLDIPDQTARDGGLYKSVDAGASWTTIDNGIALVGGTPTMGIARAIVLDPRSCAAPPASGPCPPGSGPLQTLFAVGSGRVDYSAPGLPNLSARIYKSTDAGANWSASENGLPLPIDIVPGPDVGLSYNIAITLVIDPDDTQTMYVGTAAGGPIFDPGVTPTLANGVFKSIDGGANWTHSSTGLPHYFGPGSTQHDVLALAINPADPQILYAGVSAFLPSGVIVGSVYKSTDAGATWFEASAGIAGQDVRALFIDPTDPLGDTIYAGTGGDGANPGGVYRSTDGGATWNSYSIGLPAYSATALAMPARVPGAPARILAGTNAGVWDYTEVPDEDADGAASAVENGVLAGDGNGDGTPDAQQSGVASLVVPGSAASAGAQPNGSSTSVTIAIDPGSTCGQLNDSNGQPAELFPPDPLGADSHEPWGLVNVAIPACAATTLRVTFHGATFDDGWTWRNYGPRVPGDVTSFGWYSFAGATRIDAQTWELAIDAQRQGNYRADPDDILFIGGPAHLPDLVFDHGFE
jgi:photosystem II stability/assembly factor-like uncharacterized protein